MSLILGAQKLIRAEMLFIEGTQKLSGATFSAQLCTQGAQQLVRATFSTNKVLHIDIPGMIWWRKDGRCGSKFRIRDQPGQCNLRENANGKQTCCSSYGWCGNSDAHCGVKGAKNINSGKGDVSNLFLNHKRSITVS